MAVFQEPTQWDHELGNNADVSTLPDDTSATTGVASLQKLFQLINQTPLEAGGVAPEREDINALFKYLGDQIFYTQNGGVPSYNADYDYIAGRVVLYNGNLYKCIQANDHTAPHNPTDKDYWAELSDSSDLLGKADRSLSNVDNTANILMAHNAMPSNVYDELSVGVSGTTYTAPADGYFALFFNAIANGWFNLYCANGLGASIRSINYSNYYAFLPVSKGDVVTIDHNGADYQTGNYLRFVYLNGSESEQ